MPKTIMTRDKYAKAVDQLRRQYAQNPWIAERAVGRLNALVAVVDRVNLRRDPEVRELARRYAARMDYPEAEVRAMQVIAYERRVVPAWEPDQITYLPAAEQAAYVREQGQEAAGQPTDEDEAVAAALQYAGERESVFRKASEEAAATEQALLADTYKSLRAAGFTPDDLEWHGYDLAAKAAAEKMKSKHIIESFDVDPARDAAELSARALRDRLMRSEAEAPEPATYDPVSNSATTAAADEGE